MSASANPGKVARFLASHCNASTSNTSLCPSKTWLTAVGSVSVASLSSAACSCSRSLGEGRRPTSPWRLLLAMFKACFKLLVSEEKDGMFTVQRGSFSRKSYLLLIASSCSLSLASSRATLARASCWKFAHSFALASLETMVRKSARRALPTC